MKNLHVWENEKFTESYIDFINSKFNAKDHFFLVLKKEIGKNITPRKNVIEVTNSLFGIIRSIGKFYKSDKIFLHGLLNVKIILILFLQPHLLKKSYWLIWGGDLYSYKKPKRTLKQRILEYMRHYCIKNMGGLITHIKGDYVLAQEWYDAKGKYYYSFLYPSNLYQNYDLSKVSKNKEIVYIQIGNSARPSNNHLEILKKLENFKEQNMMIICPLSYGKEEYRNDIIKEGRKKFGDKFKPLTDFIPFEDYLEILAKIDIAIFNHKRQQGMGNITTLLGLGKKVYIREDIATWEFCVDHGLKVYSTDSDFDDLFQKIDEETRQNNIKNVKKQFSEEKLRGDWEKIFNEGVKHK